MLLDPHTRRRIAAVLLIVGAVVLGLAIADVGPSSDPPTEEERAQDAVESFFAAADDGDFKRFCALLTEQARALIEQRAAALAAARDLTGCREIVEAIVGDQFDGVSVVFKDVSVSGPRARIEAHLKFEGKAGNQPKTIALEEVDGQWLVSDFQ